MPIYDYICSYCRHRLEVIHGINADGPRFCPACGAEGTMTKALTSPTVHFKGSGWAKKDRSSTSGNRTKAANASASGDAGGTASSGSSDAAPAGTGTDTIANASTDTTKPASTSED